MDLHGVLAVAPSGKNSTKTNRQIIALNNYGMLAISCADF